MTSTTQDYPGRDLEAMTQARNYYQWVLDLFIPHLGTHVVELGAGSGNFSELLRNAPGVERLTLFEPSSQMYPLLRDRFSGCAGVRCHQAIFDRDSASCVAGMDSFVAVNVLEHIEDDGQLLRVVDSLLPTGGSLCLLVPAMPSLYSRFDASIGHYRRYTQSSLRDVVEHNGAFEIVACDYLDRLGIVPWYLFMRLLRGGLSPRSVQLYDRIGVPLTRALERLAKPSFGKNLYLLARHA